MKLLQLKKIDLVYVYEKAFVTTLWRVWIGAVKSLRHIENSKNHDPENSTLHVQVSLLCYSAVQSFFVVWNALMVCQWPTMTNLRRNTALVVSGFQLWIFSCLKIDLFCYFSTTKHMFWNCVMGFIGIVHECLIIFLSFTGSEKEFFKRQNEKRATESEAYLWSVSDMWKMAQLCPSATSIRMSSSVSSTIRKFVFHKYTQFIFQPQTLCCT